MTAQHVLTAEFSHESNTFSRIPTTYAIFAERGIPEGEAAIALRGDLNTPLAGFLDVARPNGWRVTHVLSASAPPAGPVTRDAFERLAGAIVAAAEAAKDSLDGVLLGLHGAMVTDFCEDGEGELLARIRAAVQRDIPIAITLDPHTNVTAAMCDHANIIVAYKTYPHVDMRDRGRQAAEILHRAMAGEIKPVTIRAGAPMLEEVNGGRTDLGAMVDRLDRARAYEQDPDVFAVSVNGGFANADIAEVGPSVLVTGQGDMTRHRRFAEAMADEFWRDRFDVINAYHSVEEAAAICRAYRKTTGPIVVADYADNPGGGGYGDSTVLLAALLAAGVEDACFGPMVDPETAEQLQGRAVGDVVSIRLGGKTDPRFGGEPLDLTGKLMTLSDGAYVGTGQMIGGLHRSWGPTAVVRVDGIDVLVVSRPDQMLDLQQFREFGIDPAARTVVALKSAQHFRAAFTPIAGEVIVCDGGAMTTARYEMLPYAKVPRPIFPLDQDVDYDAWKQQMRTIT